MVSQKLLLKTAIVIGTLLLLTFFFPNPPQGWNEKPVNNTGRVEVCR